MYRSFQILILVMFCLIGGFYKYSCAQGISNSFPKSVTQGNFKQYKKLDTLSTIEVERHLIDFNNDKKNDTLILSNLTDLVGDPQVYTILEIRLSNKERFILKNVAGKSNDPKTKIGFKNRIKSSLLFIPELKNGKNLIFIWDNQYPDCSAQFETIEFRPNGFKSLLKTEDMYIKSITSFNEEKIINLDGTVNCGSKLIKRTVQVE